MASLFGQLRLTLPTATGTSSLRDKSASASDFSLFRIAGILTTTDGKTKIRQTVASRKTNMYFIALIWGRIDLMQK
jgi:hypothetical protein